MLCGIKMYQIIMKGGVLDWRLGNASNGGFLFKFGWSFSEPPGRVVVKIDDFHVFLFF